MLSQPICMGFHQYIHLSGAVLVNTQTIIYHGWTSLNSADEETNWLVMVCWLEAVLM